MMNYKGFIGVVEYDDDARIFSIVICIFPKLKNSLPKMKR